jgi:hypothetical protein
MPKRNPRKKSVRKPKKTVRVKSKTYRPHERAARGTYKEAVLNDAMKSHGERMRSANDPARLINGSLLLYRENFPNSQVWPRLVAHFARQAKQGLPYSVAGIADWEIDMHQKTGETMMPHVGVVVQKSSGTMQIMVNYTLSRRCMERGKRLSGFRITIIVLFPEFISNEITIVPTVLPERPLNDKSPYLFLIDIPTGADSYLLCFKADPCKDGKPDLDPRYPYKVMKILTSGKI